MSFAFRSICDIVPRSTRPLRIEFDGAFYYIILRGDGWEIVYLDDGDREIFLDVLVAICKRCNWTVHAYCLMGNHYHLLLKTTDGNLSMMGMRQCRGQDCVIAFFDVE